MRFRSEGLYEVTGDRLALEDPELAAQVYGLAGAARPTVALNRIRAQTFGDELSSITGMTEWFLDARRWSIVRAAGEAVALAGERGTWIGTRAPVSFDRAVELVRKSVTRVRALGQLRYQSPGWTGRYMFVTQVAGSLTPLPPPSPPRSRLPEKGGWVRDDLYWRRALYEHSVRLETHPVEKDPTIEMVAVAA